MLGSTSVTSSTLLNDRKLHTLTTRKRDKRVVGLAEDENVRQTSGESVTHRVLDVNNFEGTNVLLTTDDNTDTASVTTTSGHAKVTNFKANEFLDLTSSKINLDGIVHIDLRIRIADGTAVVGHKVRNTTVSHGKLGNTAKLEFGLLRSDAVDNKTTLLIIEDTEVLTSLIKSNNIHETSRITRIGANLTINLHKTLKSNVHNLTTSKSVLETVTKKEDERKALTKLVWTSSGAHGVCTTEFIKHPVLWGCDTLKVLLWAANHLCVL